MMFLRYYKNTLFDLKNSGFHFYKKEFKECLNLGGSVVWNGSVMFRARNFCFLDCEVRVVRFAAHTIAIQAEQAFYIPGYGFQTWQQL